jgi:hypothetical protein
VYNNTQCIYIYKVFDVNSVEQLQSSTWLQEIEYPYVSWNVILVRKDIDVNEHERLSNFTLRHKLK